MDDKLNKCFESGLLKRIEPSKLKAEKSLETSQRHLGEAKELEKQGFYEQAVAWAYASMFHACRALAYKDGIQEKSHYCLAAYVANEYASKGLIEWKLITALDSFREERHAIFYGLETKVAEEEALEAISVAKRMLEAVKTILNKNA